MKPKPWRMEFGITFGLAIGALLWWSAYEPGAGMLQNVQLLLVPAAIGVLAVAFRNKRKKVGAYDPETIARNRRGRV